MDSGRKLEDDMIVRVRGLSPTESGKELGEKLVLGSEGFEWWSSEERWEGVLSVESEDGCFLVLRERVGRGGIQECCNYILFYGKRLGGGGGVLGFFF